MKKKRNEKMSTPRQEVIDNPIPTSLLLTYLCIVVFSVDTHTNEKH